MDKLATLEDLIQLDEEINEAMPYFTYEELKAFQREIDFYYAKQDPFGDVF